MKINDAADGEYTDSEAAAGTPEIGDDATQAEGEYTDSDTPNGNPPAMDSTSL
ncbi:hypothetical protein BJQ94_11545 [Cryobacterium sp. SO2]|uniref:hypothetical protein n=1 Tax=Cryobacterium sp. SO2 TaxID=1897060 RepID=UPI00223E5A27|nr:hypothetical protein [Cryobacterium sp. SO2]WEO76008.1 hypothetical protein BJQ94_11545 [Cryobacterium sp. SO2]